MNGVEKVVNGVTALGTIIMHIVFTIYFMALDFNTVINRSRFGAALDPQCHQCPIRNDAIK